MPTTYNMNIQIWLMVATLTCFVATANGLICYSCDSTSNANCGDPFSSAEISSTNCSSGETCYKSEGEVFGIDFVSRGCGSYGNDCIDFFGIESCYSSCDTDECNSSTITTVSGVLLLVASGVACSIAHLV